MKPGRFVSGVKQRGQIVDVSPKAKHLAPAVVEQAFGAQPVASSAGLDLFTVREAMARLLQSSGGRPSLDTASAQVKIPKIAADWAKLERLVGSFADLPHQPSTGQVAALVLHLALGRIPEEELQAAARRKFA